MTHDYPLSVRPTMGRTRDSFIRDAFKVVSVDLIPTGRLIESLSTHYLQIVQKYIA